MSTRHVDVSPEALATWFPRWWADVSFSPEVRELAPGLYSVQSKSDHATFHRVNLNATPATCTHEYFKAGSVCSHISAAIEARDAATEAEAFEAYQSYTAPLSDPDFDDARALLDDGPVDFDAQQPARAFEGAEHSDTPAPAPTPIVAPLKPFKVGDLVRGTNPTSGRHVDGAISKFMGDLAVVRYYDARLGKWDSAAYSIANITPRVAAAKAA